MSIPPINTPPLEISISEASEEVDLEDFLLSLVDKNRTEIEEIIDKEFGIAEANFLIFEIYRHPTLSEHEKSRLFILLTEILPLKPDKINPEQIQQLIAEVDPYPLSKLLSLISAQDTAEIFCLNLLNHHRMGEEEPTNKTSAEEVDQLIQSVEKKEPLPPFEGNTHAKEVVLQLIGGSAETINLADPKGPLALCVFLNQLEEYGLIKPLVYDQFEELDQLGQTCTLWCMSEESLEGFIKICNPYRLASLLDQLLVWAKFYQEQKKWVRWFTTPLVGHQFSEFLRVLVQTEAACIPLLWTGVDEEHFQCLMEKISDRLREDLFWHSMPVLRTVMHFMVADLIESNRIRDLYCVEIDVPTQEYVRQGDAIYALNLTLDRAYTTYCEYEEEHEDDVNQVNEIIKEDLQKIPPFLLGIGMNIEEYHDWILKMWNYFSENQQKGIVYSFQERWSYHSLRVLLGKNLGKAEQKKIIKWVFYKFRHAFLIRREKRLEEFLKVVNATYNALLIQVEHQDQLHRVSAKLYSLKGKINRHFNPMNEVLLELCEGRLYFSSVEETCKEFIARMNNLRKIFETIVELIKTVETKLPEEEEEVEETVFFKKDMDAEDIKQLELIGIYTDQDLQLMEDDYVDTEDLDEIWDFLRGKGFKNISQFYEMCLLERGDPFDVTAMARKLGYK